MRRYGHALQRRDLTGTRVGDAVDRCETVGAISGQAEAAAARGMNTGTQQGYENSIAVPEGNRTPGEFESRLFFRHSPVETSRSIDCRSLQG